jgi:hypothetical protein
MDFLGNKRLPCRKHGSTPPLSITPIGYFAIFSPEEAFAANKDYVRELITKNKISVNDKTFKSYEAEHPDEATYTQQKEISEESGTKYPIPNTYTYTAIGYAAAMGLVDRVEFLLSIGANPFVKMRPVESAKEDGRGGMRLVSMNAVELSTLLRDSEMDAVKKEKLAGIVRLFETGYTVGGYSFMEFLRMDS